MIGGLLGVLLCASVADAQSAPSLRGRVLDTTGRPLEGVEVLLGGVPRTGSTDGNGRFRIDSLEARNYALTARSPGYRPVRVSIAVRAEGVTEIELRMEPFPQILDSVVVEATRRGLYGIVGDSALQPIVGARVQVFVGVRSQLTDSAGRFAYPEIKPGDYLVSTTHAGLGSRPRHVTVPRNGYTEVVILLTARGSEARPRGEQFAFHDLGMRLAMHPSSTRLTREDLAQFAGRQICDIPVVRGTIVDLPLTIVDGTQELRHLTLCHFSADELAMVELTCVGATGMPRLSVGRKARCFRVWTR